MSLSNEIIVRSFISTFEENMLYHFIFIISVISFPFENLNHLKDRGSTRNMCVCACACVCVCVCVRELGQNLLFLPS